MKTLPLLLFLLAIHLCHAQTTITGNVVDAGTGQPLQFASVRVVGEAAGTTTDRHGRFMLHLDTGMHSLVASYIGYRSEKKEILRGIQPVELTFRLSQSRIELPEVLVTPGDNPALAIIRQAIESKERRKERLKNYRLTSHSKLVVSIDRLSGGIVEVGAGRGGRMAQLADSGMMVVLETQTDAFWARPDRYKEIIKARKQTATIPSSSNILISSFFIIDFSSDLLQLSDKSKVVGPISDAGLRNYDYTLSGTTMLDGERLHIIRIRPLSEVDPLLEGTLYIADGSFALAMVDVKLNEAAKPTFFKDLRFRQHFRLFDNTFWMPTDVVVDAAVEVSMIVDLSMKIEGFAVLQDYLINNDSTETVFDRTRLIVLKEADERDSLYWAREQKLVNSAEEQEAYRRSDSIQASIDETKNSYGFSDAFLGKTFSSDRTRITVPGLLGLYHFNRVEGHALNFSLSAVRLFEPFDRLSFGAGYGFDDRHGKWNAGISMRLMDRLGLRLDAFDRLTAIDENTSMLGETNTTISNLFFKFDDKDYYRKRGFIAMINTDPLLMIPLTLSTSYQSYFSTSKNTDWSIVRQQWRYRDNPRINDGDIFSFGASISFDNRDLMDNAGEIRRFGRRMHVPVLAVAQHFADIGSEQFSYTVASFMMNGGFDLGRLGSIDYRLTASSSMGKLPTQQLLLLTGSVPYLSTPSRFRTLQPREYGGDKVASLFIDHDFGDQIFRWLHIPFLESSGWGLRVFGAAGWSSMTDDTRHLQTVPVLQSLAPVYEMGISLDRIFLMFRLDLAWRLSHFRAGRNFCVGISTPLIF